jgi:hypothetical protein
MKNKTLRLSACCFPKTWKKRTLIAKRALRLIKKLHPNAVIQISSSVWKTGSRDIRDVLKIAKLCNPADTEEDINRLLSISQKYRKTGNEYN